MSSPQWTRFAVLQMIMTFVLGAHAFEFSPSSGSQIGFKGAKPKSLAVTEHASPSSNKYARSPLMRRLQTDNSTDDSESQDYMPDYNYDYVVENRMKMDVYIMSKCDDAAAFFWNIYWFRRDHAEAVDVNLEFIVFKTPDGAFWDSRHGWNEVRGDKLLACAQDMYDRDTSLAFMDCLFEFQEAIPQNALECSQYLGMNYTELHTCMNSGRPIHLLQASHDKAAALNITWSPTITLNDSLYCKYYDDDLPCPSDYWEWVYVLCSAMSLNDRDNYWGCLEYDRLVALAEAEAAAQEVDDSSVTDNSDDSGGDYYITEDTESSWQGGGNSGSGSGGSSGSSGNSGGHGNHTV
eukprot:GFYU01001627.1.p1 GENE.GFYU01001627.1~~GFYU01001627.1.p1  ORF type:complete len:350 (+),score=61.38 GFYU01001627.1:159-1208(+)